MSNITPGLKFGFAWENITPKRNIGLQGYFEPRPNRGVHDQLNVRAAVFECNGIVVGIVSSDLGVMKYSLVKRIIRELEANGITFAEKIVFSVTHTHTGPYTANEGAVTPDGDRLIIGKFCAIASGTKFIMGPANHRISSVTTYPFHVFGGA